MTKPKYEDLKEGWVEFRRHYEENGEYTDVWIGDMADNPNNKEKSHITFDAFVQYARKKGSKWVILDHSE